jgi:hypothetical protein
MGFLLRPFRAKCEEGVHLSDSEAMSAKRLGIASNVSFNCYATIAGMPPILILHSLLLPMNIYPLVRAGNLDGGRVNQDG